MDNKKDAVKIIPLGGLEEIGMNITAIEYQDSIIVIDCGLSFPDDDMLGIDLVIPDVTYLKENADKVKGLIVTHGHEDHIGAIPYVEKQINMPIYATKLTMGIIDYKLREHNLINNIKRKVCTYGQIINLGCFRVEFIRTNHSIADSAALAVYTPKGLIIHTGDFKVDYTPVFGGVIDLQRFAELGKKGVMLLMADSTNVERKGFTPSEKTLGTTFDHLFDENSKRRIIVATFASNVDRVQQIINSAHKYGRKVFVEGRSMVNIMSIATELGYLKIPDGVLLELDRINEYPGNKEVIITTGSQGENMAALSRIAANIHSKITIVPGDLVIFSSSPIPGNEKAVSKVINELEQKGAKVIYHDTHVSGHACEEEIKLIYTLTKPKYALPVHGEYKHLRKHMELAETMGIPKDRIMIMRTGDVLHVADDVFEIDGKVQAGEVLVDGLGVGDVGNIVLRDRQHLAENGIVVVAISIDKVSKEVLAGPDIISRGFVYVREAEELIEQCKCVVEETMDNEAAKGYDDYNRLKNAIREDLGEFLWNKTRRSPVVLPVISEVVI